jgi:hypothetical protein
MNPQTLEIAALARDVAAKSLLMLFARIDPAALDADVVAHRHGQGVHYVALVGMGSLEGFAQNIEERPPKVRVYSMKPSVEASLGDRLVDISVFIQKRPCLLDIAAEESSREKCRTHHLGSAEADLLVVAVACGLEELL